MPKITVNGVRLNYEIRGSGPKLLFINGIGADMKHPVGLFNSPMMDHFTILAYDARGLGESDSPKAPCSMANLAEDAAQLAKAVGWDKYHVFGASMGGQVAQELAIRHPDGIDRLVLIVTHSGGNNGAPDLSGKLLELSPLEMLKASDSRQDEKWAAAHPEALERMKLKAEEMKAYFESNASLMRGYHYQSAAVAGHNTTERLKDITAETLVINGKFDGGIPVSAAQEMAKRIRNSRFELVEHGHGSWFFDSKVWDMIIDFYK